MKKIVRDYVAVHKGEVPVSFDRLKADAENHKTEMESLRRKYPKIRRVLFRFHKKDDAQPEHIPRLVDDLTTYLNEVSENEKNKTGFSEYDIMQAIFYLKEKLLFERVKRQLRQHLTAKNGIAERKENDQKGEYIPFAELCDDPDCDLYHTKAEHQKMEEQKRAELEEEDRKDREEQARKEREQPDDDDDYGYEDEHEEEETVLVRDADGKLVKREDSEDDEEEEY